MRIGILISGTGSNMIALVRAMQADGWAKPAIVLSDQQTAKGIARAQDMGVRARAIPYTGDRTAHEQAMVAALQGAQVDLICLAGYMRVLSANFIAQWQGRILNIHPSLLPKYKGLNTHKRAIDAGDKVAGCSVHIVTEKLDDGPVLAQAQVAIAPDDTAQSLGAKVLVQEHILYPKTVAAFVKG